MSSLSFSVSYMTTVNIVKSRIRLDWIESLMLSRDIWDSIGCRAHLRLRLVIGRVLKSILMWDMLRRHRCMHRNRACSSLRLLIGSVLMGMLIWNMLRGRHRVGHIPGSWILPPLCPGIKVRLRLRLGHILWIHLMHR
jgi:hypothetical protein